MRILDSAIEAIGTILVSALSIGAIMGLLTYALWPLWLPLLLLIWIVKEIVT